MKSHCNIWLSSSKNAFKKKSVAQCQKLKFGLKALENQRELLIEVLKFKKVRQCQHPKRRTLCFCSCFVLWCRTLSKLPSPTEVNREQLMHCALNIRIHQYHSYSQSFVMQVFRFFFGTRKLQSRSIRIPTSREGPKSTPCLRLKNKDFKVSKYYLLQYPKNTKQLDRIGAPWGTL